MDYKLTGLSAEGTVLNTYETSGLDQGAILAIAADWLHDDMHPHPIISVSIQDLTYYFRPVLVIKSDEYNEGWRCKCGSYTFGGDVFAVDDRNRPASSFPFSGWNGQRYVCCDCGAIIDGYYNTDTPNGYVQFVVDVIEINAEFNAECNRLIKAGLA